MSGKTKRRQVIMKDDWYAAAVKEAEKKGQSFSAWMCDAAKARLPKATQKRLSKRAGPGQYKRKRARK